MRAGRQALFFFPDHLLVCERRCGAVPYGMLHATVQEVRFSETEKVPESAQIVGQTWRYVNKDGRPDRRFGGNYEIPIVLYGDISLVSDSGLNETFQCSDVTAARRFAGALEEMQKLERPEPASTTNLPPTMAERLGRYEP